MDVVVLVQEVDTRAAHSSSVLLASKQTEGIWLDLNCWLLLQLKLNVFFWFISRLLISLNSNLFFPSNWKQRENRRQNHSGRYVTIALEGQNRLLHEMDSNGI